MHTAEKYITASQIGRDHTIKPSKLKGSTNNSVGFVCRKVTGGGGWSAHAYGKAIDINPQQNPYVKGKTVLPTNGNTSRKAIAGTLTTGGWAIKAFTSRGFSWWFVPLAQGLHALSGVTALTRGERPGNVGALESLHHA